MFTHFTYRTKFILFWEYIIFQPFMYNLYRFNIWNSTVNFIQNKMFKKNHEDIWEFSSTELAFPGVLIWCEFSDEPSDDIYDHNRCKRTSEVCRSRKSCGSKASERWSIVFHTNTQRVSSKLKTQSHQGIHNVNIIIF